LLERERQMREQEDRENEQKERELRERGKKRIAGLRSLGPVQSREEVAPPRPAPSKYQPPRSVSSGSKMELNIPRLLDDRATSLPSSCGSCGTTYLPNAKFCCECGAKKPEAPAPKADDSDDDSDDEEATRPTLGQWKRPPPSQQAQPKKKGKRKRKRNKRDPDQEGQDEDEWIEEQSADAEEELEDTAQRADPQDPIERARKQAREHGKIYQNMVVENIKGMVSNNYKGFTDADLERRFQLPDSGSKGSLMTEEQVRQMINKERGEKNSAATQRRIQREQAEWQEKLKEHKARESGVHSNSRFERTVVGRTSK